MEPHFIKKMEIQITYTRTGRMLFFIEQTSESRLKPFPQSYLGLAGALDHLSTQTEDCFKNDFRGSCSENGIRYSLDLA